MLHVRRHIVAVTCCVLSVFVCVGAPHAEAVFEKSTKLSTSYYFRNSGESFYIFPGYVTGQVDVTHTVEQVNPHTDKAFIGDSINFVFNHQLPVFYNTGGAWDTPNGKWCPALNDQCFSMTDEGTNDEISPADPKEIGAYGKIPVKLYWTGIRPETKLVSSNPSVVRCPNTGAEETLACQAVGAGTATLSAQVDLTPLQFWLQVYNRFSYLYVWFSKDGGYNITSIFNSQPPTRGFTLFPNTQESALVAEYADDTRVRVSLTPTADYLKYLDTLNQPALSAWFSYLSNHGFTATHIADLLESEYSTSEHITFDPFFTKMPLQTLTNLLASTNKASFKEAIVSQYPVSVPMVSEYSPNNQGNSLFLPKTTLGPWTITVTAPAAHNDSPLAPTVTPTTPIEVGADSQIGMVSTDPDGDPIRYCVDWNEDGDSIDNTDTSTDFLYSERCFPAIGDGYVSSGTSRDAWQAWKTISPSGNPKTFRVYAEDDKGARSPSAQGSVVVTQRVVPTVDMKINGLDSTSVNKGDTVTFSWTTTNCTPTYPCVCDMINNAGFASWTKTLPHITTDTHPSETALTAENGIFTFGITCTNTTRVTGADQATLKVGDILVPPTTPSPNLCNNNGRCERLKENFVNCPSDCPKTIQESQAPRPGFWAFLLGVFR